MKKYILILFLSLSLFGEDIRLINAINMSKDPTKQEKAAEELLKLSFEGNTKAMTQFGRILIYGKGVPQDCKKGTYFLINALSKTETHDPDYEALKELALMFKRGLCVKKDMNKFRKYIKRYNEKKALKK